MNERDKELAIEAGLAKPYVSKTRRESGVVIKDTDAVQKFADLIRADERDRMCERFNLSKELAHEKAKGNETN